VLIIRNAQMDAFQCQANMIFALSNGPGIRESCPSQTAEMNESEFLEFLMYYTRMGQSFGLYMDADLSLFIELVLIYQGDDSLCEYIADYVRDDEALATLADAAEAAADKVPLRTWRSTHGLR